MVSLDMFDPMKDLLDLSGKVVLVTGGNRGVGYGIVKHLARRGAKVYLAARDESKATDAIMQLQAEGLAPGNGEVVWLKLDLIDPRLAQKAAEDFLSKETKLDILVNNAALLPAPYMETSDGVSHSMVINHISPFVFTRSLLPLLIATSKEPDADVRIINVSSQAQLHVPPNLRFRNLDDFNEKHESYIWPAFTRYAVSKLANILFSKELQSRLDADGVAITVMAVHPGAVGTFYHMLPFQLFTAWLLSFFFVTPDKGAYSPAFAAASPDVRANPKKYRGKFLCPVGVLTEVSEQANDMDLAKEIWQTTERFLESIGVSRFGKCSY